MLGGCLFAAQEVEGKDWQETFMGRLFVETTIKPSPNQMLPFYRFVPLLGGFFPVVRLPAS